MAAEKEPQKAGREGTLKYEEVGKNSVGDLITQSCLPPGLRGLVAPAKGFTLGVART